MYLGHRYTLSPELMLKKYTGEERDLQEPDSKPIRECLADLMYCEMQLLLATEKTRKTSDAIDATIMAMPGDRFEPMRYEGDDIPGLIIRREESIKRLKVLVCVMKGAE